MAEDTNNHTFFVNGTTCTSDSPTFTFTTDNVWFPYYDESTWLPYHETKYTPKWHIELGYKKQIKSMWD